MGRWVPRHTRTRIGLLDFITSTGSQSTMARPIAARLALLFPSALRVRPNTGSQSTMASPAGVHVAAAPIDAGGGGGAEPDLKKRRLLDAGGPIEDDETARQKMRDAKVYERDVNGTYGEYVGFDPDNVADIKSFSFSGKRDVKPMGYFAGMGDLPMMRWLYVNGADTQDKMVSEDWFPMCAAAMVGHLGVCKWLFQHGAAGDIKRKVRIGFAPLSAIFGQWDTRDVSRWLILRGALCEDGDTGNLNVGLMRQSLGRPAANGPEGSAAGERPELLKWAKEHHQTRSSFDVFLMGTLPAPTYSATKLRDELLARIGTPSAVDRILAIASPDQSRLLWDDLFAHRVCNLAVFSGKSGILELIGDYVGTMRGREARIVRQLTELLPGIIAELGRN